MLDITLDDAVVDMVRGGYDAAIRVAFVVEQMVKPLIGEGRLIPLLQGWSAPFPGFFLCYPEQRQMAPALRAFINQVRGLGAADIRCLIPGFDGAVSSQAWKEALWARFSTAAPRRQRRSVEQYKVVKRA